MFFQVIVKNSFFDVHIYNNILLVYEVQRFCRDFGERYSLDLILDIIQNRLQKMLF